MSTVSDVVKRSLRLIGAIAVSETPTAAELQDGMQALNTMLESWSTEETSVYGKTREVFTLVPSQSSYSMGTGGDFNTTRPIKIIQMLWQDDSVTPALEIPITMLTQREFADISVKNTEASLTWSAWVNYTHPTVTINLYAVPNVARKVVIYSWKALTSYSSLTTTVDLAPGYERAVVYNLALELAPEYGRQPASDVYRIAMESKENIERSNSEPMIAQTDPALITTSGVFNYIDGDI